jgi:L-malate glycosyltransferase
MSAEASAATWPRVCVVGPLPPPSGGMANQCEQLVRLLRAEGVTVELVRNNPPYWPRWVGHVPLLRAGFRLLPYLMRLWSAAGRAQVMHLLANSGWAWHLFAAPALMVGRLRRTPVIVNYRGGYADQFFASAPAHVRSMLRSASLRVTPSSFLQRVFKRHGLVAEVIPNIIDLSRFGAAPPRAFGLAPCLLVARNLEPIYDISTALRAFASIRVSYRDATLLVAGTGEDLARLQALAAELGVAHAVEFTGRVDNAAMPALYARADCAINPSTVDNMPISVLEAFASGIPVVSTDVGGVPDIVTSGVNGVLVPPGDPCAMASAILSVLRDRAFAARLSAAGLLEAQRYAWPAVRQLWFDAYRRAARSTGSLG